MPPQELELSVIVITRDRPDSLMRCARALASEMRPSDEVIVVSGSGAADERALLANCEGFTVFQSEHANMPHQRNVGLEHARGDVVAFVDDDAFVCAGWRDAIVAPYSDPGVGSVVGKETRESESHVRSSAPAGVTWSGVIRPLYDFDSAEMCDVATGQGCNMSFRRSVLQSLGGFDPDYLQRANCEETDVFSRLTRAGHRIVYNPRAVVLHVPDRPVGYSRSEFDRRSAFHLHRNRAYFFTKNYLGKLPFFTYLLRDTGFTAWISLRRIVVIVTQTSAVFLLAVAGNVVGVWHGLRRRLRGE